MRQEWKESFIEFGACQTRIDNMNNYKWRELTSFIMIPYYTFYRRSSVALKIRSHHLISANHFVLIILPPTLYTHLSSTNFSILSQLVLSFGLPETGRIQKKEILCSVWLLLKRVFLCHVNLSTQLCHDSSVGIALGYGLDDRSCCCCCCCCCSSSSSSSSSSSRFQASEFLFTYGSF
jgi:hypothetical protein